MTGQILMAAETTAGCIVRVFRTGIFPHWQREELLAAIVGDLITT